MNSIRIFENVQFGKIRIAMDGNNEPWFVGKDVAEALGYAKPENAIAAHVDEEDKTTTLIQGTGSNYKSKTTIINESGIYSLILSSQLPSAKIFKKWVTSEVLPSIRKHGAYMTEQTIEKALTSPDFLIQLATNLKEEQQKRFEAEQKIAKDAPKVLFCEAVQGSVSSCLVDELAKMITQNGIKIGEKKLYQWLRDNHYLCAVGNKRNLPYQKYIEQGLFEIREGVRSGRDGEMHTTSTTKVTGKGQVYFIDKFLGKQ